MADLVVARLERQFTSVEGQLRDERLPAALPDADDFVVVVIDGSEVRTIPEGRLLYYPVPADLTWFTPSLQPAPAVEPNRRFVKRRPCAGSEKSAPRAPRFAEPQRNRTSTSLVSRSICSRAGPSAICSSSLPVTSLEGSERRLTGVSLTAGGFCWQGNNAIIFRRNSGLGTEFWRLDLTTRQETLLFQDAGGNTSCSADGMAVAYIREGPTLAMLKVRNLASGAASEVFLVGFNGGAAPLSSDGKLVAFLASGDVRTPGKKVGTAILVGSIDGGNIREVARATPPSQLKVGIGLAWSADGKYVYYSKRVNEERDFELFSRSFLREVLRSDWASTGRTSAI